MNRYYIQYHSQTIASLKGRKEQQTFPFDGWVVDFPKLELRIVLADSVKETASINLHTGLNIIANLRANSVEEAKETSKNVVETILNLISFSTLTHCNAAKLVSIASIVDKEPHRFTHFAYPFDGHEMMGSVRIVDEPTFRAIFEAFYESSNQQRIMRALTWLRKGIGEENSVDEFVSYWVGLEVAKPILRRNLRRKVRNPREWDGVEDIFTGKLRFNNFGAIKKKARNGLLHGFRELDDEFMREISGYLDPIRKTLVCCIGSILGLEDNAILTIANKTPARIPQVWTVMDGDLRNLPRDLNELLEKYPTVDAEILNKEFSIDGSGNLSMKFTVNHHFHGPNDTKWNVKSVELWGNREAGIQHESTGIRHVETR